ncbi:hypothetical protein GQ55_4G107600 [Panicum hallii var. hallii]|uniref:Uncharacterized protein n=1 Tax=Panicum hallii var. hallii TaxID=1504633 RepID=A0A2T7DXD0_9POAL|nr:hypothetical protein GQ55_4G107600 [Panicum hallii var. hallii]
MPGVAQSQGEGVRRWAGPGASGTGGRAGPVASGGSWGCSEKRAAAGRARGERRWRGATAINTHSGLDPG